MGADEPIRSGGPSYPANVEIGFVHHTDTSNDYTAAQSASIVRSIYAYHVLSNGWSVRTGWTSRGHAPTLRG